MNASQRVRRPRARVVAAAIEQRVAAERAHSMPTAIAVSSEATKRAATTSGWPGKATAVATSTTGLIAGADSMKANAAAGATPRAVSRPAIGTEPHSQPGSATPAKPGDRNGKDGALGQVVGQPPRRHERRDRAADGHAEHQERQRLHGDRHEHRRPHLQRRVVEQACHRRAAAARRATSSSASSSSVGSSRVRSGAVRPVGRSRCAAPPPCATRRSARPSARSSGRPGPCRSAASSSSPRPLISCAIESSRCRGAQVARQPVPHRKAHVAGGTARSRRRAARRPAG